MKGTSKFDICLNSKAFKSNSMKLELLKAKPNLY